MTGQSGPSSAGPVAAGFDQAASAYDATGTEFFTLLGGRLAAHAGIRAGERVADLGCGAGAALIPAAVAAGPGGHVTGVDASPAMLARAREAARARGVEVTLRTGDAEDPPLAPGSLNVITASSVLQFLPRPRRAVRAWLKLLAPGGRIAVSWGMRQDPAWAPVMAVLDDEVPRQSAPGFEEYLRRPPFNSAGALERMLAEAGYTATATRTESLTTTYDSPGQWWAACQGQAPWIVSWRHIPPGVLVTVRGAAFSLVDGLRGGDGRIRRTLTFGCTVASRPS
ncbi:MAG TPA: methyltransferase domain-containing protein [Trebonia sp.]|nr:methyltransferase domain-containing protein [Trebonia sp.]